MTRGVVQTKNTCVGENFRSKRDTAKSAVSRRTTLRDLCRVTNAASNVPTVSLGLSGVSSRPGTCVWPAHMWDSRRRNGVDRGVCQDFAREFVSRWSRIRVDRHAWVSVGTSTWWTQIWGTRCAIGQAGRGAFGPKRSDPGGTDSPTWTPQNESVTPR